MAVVDKEKIITIQRDDLKVLNTSTVKIKKSQLQEDIKLSRFVRNLHYGRGLFDGDISLLINDYAAFALLVLTVTGTIRWYRKKKLSIGFL